VRLFGPRRQEQEARAAELRGDFAQAAALFAEAGLLDEAARVTMLRGDAEGRHAARMRHYSRAAALAPEGSALRNRARTKRALAAVALASEGPTTAAARRDLADAAQELESLGEHQMAADAYARAGDAAGQLRALEHAGSVEAVEALLALENARDQAVRARRRDSDEFASLLAGGRRREAVALADASHDEGLRELGRRLVARRVAGSEVLVSLGGRPTARVLLGARVVVGRGPAATYEGLRTAAVAIGSAALSRDHLAIWRRGADVVVGDLGSRHGTTLGSEPLGAAVPVGEGLDLLLARTLRVIVKPSDDALGGVSIEVGAASYLAPLGPARLGVGRWRLERGADDWIELVTEDDPPAFAGGLRWAPQATLIAGDSIACERGGVPAIAIAR
jgi:hypothetical protein